MENRAMQRPLFLPFQVPEATDLLSFKKFIAVLETGIDTLGWPEIIIRDLRHMQKQME